MNKLLVISGASRGIGAATAERFLDSDYNVISFSRTATGNSAIHQIAADFSQPNWPDELHNLQELISEAQEITLIHNASMIRKDSVHNAASELAKVMQINVMAAQQLNEVILPHMQKGSSILYVGSTLSEKAVANTLSYSVSKHAVVGLMRATCQDLAGSGIHTAAVCPGFTDTDMLRNHVGNNEDVIRDIESNVSYGRLIRPEEIAETLWFCANNPVINGSIIHANLGQIES
jgi:3-oxoacyl-[acyl-carrier protein] reductase